MPATPSIAVPAYEQFELRLEGPDLRAKFRALETVRTRIERVPADFRIAGRLAEYRSLAREGWQVTALLAADSRTVVLLGCLEPVDERRKES